MNTIAEPNSEDRARLHEFELYKLLLKKLPPEYLRGDDRLNVKMMCKVTGRSQFTICRWLRGTHFTKRSIEALLLVSKTTEYPQKKGLLTAEDLIPFAFDL